MIKKLITKMLKLLVLVGLVLAVWGPSSLSGQSRGLLHWKRDLEYRFNSYMNQRRVLDEIISSSVDVNSERRTMQGPVRIYSGSGVRFSDLLIPTGSLVLDAHIAEPTVRFVRNKTQTYVNSKMNDLYQVKSQLENLKRQLNDPSQQYIYKGTPASLQKGPMNYTRVGGLREFKQLMYAQLVESRTSELKQIRFSEVNPVLDQIYLENQQFQPYDSKSRLYIEGRKTLWNSEFYRDLKSGCCDRLRPLHTNRMMHKSLPQVVQAPVIIKAAAGPSQPIAQVLVRNLASEVLVNRQLKPEAPEAALRPPRLGGDNPITPDKLIDIRSGASQQAGSTNLDKTLVFADLILADEAEIVHSFVDKRVAIGVSGLGVNGSLVELELRPSGTTPEGNQLLKYQAAGRLNMSSVGRVAQRVLGSLVVTGEAHFLANVEAEAVNSVSQFGQFVANSIVRLDRPALIRGPVQFNALSSVFKPGRPAGPGNAAAERQRAAQNNVLVMRVHQDLQLGSLNGMRLPADLVYLAPHRAATPAGQPIVVRGSRYLDQRATFGDHLWVEGLVNGLRLPEEVIPLHLNDFVHNTAPSNLWFLDGISVRQLTVESGHFDELNLREWAGDAQSQIMRSMVSHSADGSQAIIRAPLRVQHLRLLPSATGGAARGLLNGFRPQELLELSAGAAGDGLRGRRLFRAPVVAGECILGSINSLQNWTSHLVRIDRPGSAQVVHARLAFVQSPANAALESNSNSSEPLRGPKADQLRIQHLSLEFAANQAAAQYARNLQFAPEFYLLHQALSRRAAAAGQPGQGQRLRVLGRLQMAGPKRLVNRQVALEDVVTLSEPFAFADRYIMVGKVEVQASLRAGRVQSQYPIDAMDLVQFDQYRIPTAGSSAPVRLANLVLGQGNSAAFVRARLLNGLPVDDFIASIMSLTRPQQLHSSLHFGAPVSFEGMVRSSSSLNGIKHFRSLADGVRAAGYSFEDGLQCNSVVVRE